MLIHGQNTALRPSLAPLEQRRLRGVLNGSGQRYGINLSWDGTQLSGRLGGWLLGEQVQLERSGDALLGTVSSGTVRLAVHARFTPDEHNPDAGRLELHLAGSRFVQTATMTLHPDCVTGTAEAEGSSVEINLALTPAVLEGRIGNGGLGQHVHLERSGVSAGSASGRAVPNFVLVTAALLVDAVNREVSRVLLESLNRMREG